MVTAAFLVANDLFAAVAFWFALQLNSRLLVFPFLHLQSSVMLEAALLVAVAVQVDRCVGYLIVLAAAVSVAVAGV